MNKDVFSANSMYKDLMETDTLPDFCTSWKPKLPLKIIVFLWYLKKGVILKNGQVKGVQIGQQLREAMSPTARKSTVVPDGQTLYFGSIGSSGTTLLPHRRWPNAVGSSSV